VNGYVIAIATLAVGVLGREPGLGLLATMAILFTQALKKERE